MFPLKNLACKGLIVAHHDRISILADKIMRK